MKNMKKLKFLVTLLVFLGVSLSFIGTSTQQVKAITPSTRFYNILSEYLPVYNSAGTQIGTVYPNDECWYNDVNVISLFGTKYMAISYPVTGGSKSGYIKMDRVFLYGNAISPFYQEWQSYTPTFAMYRSTTQWGTIYPNDKVYIGNRADNGRVQVRYPVSGGYKLGWI